MELVRLNYVSVMLLDSLLAGICIAANSGTAFILMSELLQVFSGEYQL